MNKDVRGLIGRVPISVWIAVAAVVVALVWFSFQGLSGTSAGGFMGMGSQGSNATQESNQGHKISNCLFPGIPC